MVDSVRLLEAVNFAAIKHRDQRRLDSQDTPYINHPVGVARILAHEGGVEDIDVLIGAILHDTVEDTDTTFEEIEVAFGLVDEVSDDKSKPYAERKRLQIINAQVCSQEAKLVKLADKLYNLRDLERETPQGWTESRKAKYFAWSRQVIQGLRGTNAKLEHELDQILERNQ
eukprot:maker-scaffold84_size396325-snap-gene-2.34 protein:Tk09693 transcript:maker-scaffold84_size396325-snap-gene-2.34-mRNA-1 annotation:"novel hd domain containing protein"